MKTFTLLLVLCTYGSTISYNQTKWHEWENFKKTYAKTYQNEKEETYRRTIFLKTFQTIEEHNKRYDQGLATYSAGINKFADFEVSELYPASRPSTKFKQRPIKSVVPKTEVPDSIDWRDYGVIGPILDQRYCLSCWAFAVVDAVEAHVGIHLNRKNLSLSQENLIDCVYTDFNCDKEMERTALEDSYRYIVENGIATDESYPYDQKPDECRFHNGEVGATITDYGTIPEGEENVLKTVVGTIGPVSVIITVDTSFMIYRKGVYYKENCNDTDEPFNHAVTVVGYGNEGGQDYWLVRNEWSTIFGDQGYIKMARNRGNLCGIATYASYPIIV